MSQSVPTSSHAQNLTGQTVNYFGPVLKGAEILKETKDTNITNNVKDK